MDTLNHLFDDLEEYRTPQEMKLYFEQKKEIIYENEEYRKIARLKKGKVKKFIEEFYPMYLFSHSKFFEANAKCKIVLGNQGYDVSIIQQDGTEKNIEITSYIEGKWEYEDAIRLNTRGFGDVRFDDYKNLNERALDYLAKVLKNINKKSLKDYSGVSILFVVETFDYFEVYENTSQPFVDKLLKEMQNFEFKADDIYLMVLNEQGTDQIDKNIYLVK